MTQVGLATACLAPDHLSFGSNRLSIFKTQPYCAINSHKPPRSGHLSHFLMMCYVLLVLEVHGWENFRSPLKTS